MSPTIIKNLWQYCCQNHKREGCLYGNRSKKPSPVEYYWI